MTTIWDDVFPDKRKSRYERMMQLPAPVYELYVLGQPYRVLQMREAADNRANIILLVAMPFKKAEKHYLARHEGVLRINSFWFQAPIKQCQQAVHKDIARTQLYLELTKGQAVSDPRKLETDDLDLDKELSDDD